MKMPSLIRNDKQPKPAPSPAGRRVRGYCYFFATLLLAPILLQKNALGDAIAASIPVAAGLIMLMLVDHFQTWKSGVKKIVYAAAISLIGLFSFTILVSTFYVARYGAAVAPLEGYGWRILAYTYIAASHFAAEWLARRRWPDHNNIHP